MAEFTRALVAKKIDVLFFLLGLGEKCVHPAKDLRLIALENILLVPATVLRVVNGSLSMRRYHRSPAGLKLRELNDRSHRLGSPGGDAHFHSIIRDPSAGEMGHKDLRDELFVFLRNSLLFYLWHGLLFLGLGREEFRMFDFNALKRNVVVKYRQVFKC